MTDHDKTERERFEAWARNERDFPLSRTKDGHYRVDATGDAWSAWQARAVLDTGTVPAGWKLVPDGQTPLDARLEHPLLAVINEGVKSRDTGSSSPYHGHSLEHCLHAVGWVQRDLRLALDAANKRLSAPQPPASASAGMVPVAYIQAETLDALRNDKMATTMVASGLLRKPFGNPVPLYTSPIAQPVAALTEVQWLKKRTGETGRAIKGRERDEFLSLMRFAERALQAQPATPAQPVTVSVKPLEFPPRCPRGQRVHSRPQALIRYTIAHHGGDAGSTVFQWASEGAQWSEPHHTYEAAIGCAQADYEQRIRSALVVEPAPPDAYRQGCGEWKPTHRHVKRGSTYRVIGEAEAQVSTGTLLTLSGEVISARTIRDGDRLTVYQGEDGRLWVHFSDEFNDGRFEQIPGDKEG